MNTLINATAALPKPEGESPFAVSSDIFIRIAYPIARDFALSIGSINPKLLGQCTIDSVQAFFEPEKDYRQREWLYAICESGPSSGYQVTYHVRGLQNHPLAEIGLAPQNVFELGNSSWLLDRQANISDLAAQLSIPSPKLKHYVFAFDDTVFECATTHFETEYVFGSVYDVSTYVAGSMKWWQ